MKAMQSSKPLLVVTRTGVDSCRKDASTGKERLREVAPDSGGKNRYCNRVNPTQNFM